jgi:hypothetical protein
MRSEKWKEFIEGVAGIFLLLLIFFVIGFVFYMAIGHPKPPENITGNPQTIIIIFPYPHP